MTSSFRSRRLTQASWTLATTLALSGLTSAASYASTLSLSYSGRLTLPSGAPTQGPIDIDVNFYDAQTGGNKLGSSPFSFTGIPLAQGVFELQIPLPGGDITKIFPDPTVATWIEITDKTSGKTYPRQHFSVIPYALKVPVDGKTVAFDSDGNLALALTSLPSGNQFLTKDGSGHLVWGSPATASSLQGQTVSATAPTNGQVLQYNGTQWVPQGLSLTSGTVTNVTATSPLAVTTGSSTPALSITQATSVSGGYLSSADWLNFSGMLPKTGGTMSGAINMGSQPLTNLAAPTSANDAATKAYVDAGDGLALKKDGSVGLTSAWAVGNDLTSVGNVGIAAQKTLLLGTLTGAQETTLVGTLTVGASSPDKGKTWFNSTTNQIKYFDGTTAQVVGAAGSGLTNLNGATGNTQTFATPGTTGTAPSWSTVGNAHTLSIPLASAASVTAGLLSNADYTTFTNKIGTVAAGTGLSVGTVGTTATVSLANAGTAGTYAKVTTNAQGQVTSGTTLGATDIPSLDASKITTGQLGVANGGTGLAGGTSGGVPYYSGATTIASSGALTANGVLLGGGAGAAPTATAALTNGQLLIGSTGAGPVPASLTQGATAGVTISGGAGSLALDTAQDIRSTASPTFAALSTGSGAVTAATHVAGTSDGAASPVGGTIRASSAAGTDKPGASLTVNAGNGTGTGGSGQIILQTAAAGSTGSAADAYQDWFRLTNTGAAIFGAGEGTATVAAATLRGPAVTGTDKVGAGLTIAAGNGTGTGGSGALSFQTAATASTSATANTLATRMTITPGGNIGLGTTAPGSILDVNGAVTHRGIAAPSTSPAGQGRLYFDSSTNHYYVSENNGAFTQLLTSGSGATNITANSPLSLSGTALSLTGTVGVANGGTGDTTFTTNGIPFGNGTSAMGVTAAGSQYQVLQAGAAGVPTFGALNLGQAAALTGTLPFGNGGTGVTTLTSNGVVLGNGTGNLVSTAAGSSAQVFRVPTGGGTPAFGAIDLAQSGALTNALGVANGGTGAATLTTSGMLYGNGTSAVGATAAGSQYQVFQAGASGVPTVGALNLAQSAAVTGALGVANGGTGLTATPTNGQLAIGNGTNFTLAALAQGATSGVTVTNGSGSITLDTAQDIRTSASPTFAGLGLGSGTLTGATHVAGTSDGGASPGAGTLRGANGAGTDKVGAALTIAAGNGTGTGGSGVINFQTAPVASTSSTANALATRMTIDKTGNVGIGTTVPGKALQVASSNTNDTSIEITNSSGTVAGNWLLSAAGGSPTWGVPAGSFGLFNVAANSTPLVVTPAGNVGIGTTTPGLRLDIEGIAGAPATSGTSQTGIARFGTQPSSGLVNVLDVGAYSSSPYGLWFQGSASSNLNPASYTYPLIFQPNGGNVGIGTTAPAYTLDIAGSGRIAAVGAANLFLTATGTGGRLYSVGGTDNGNAALGGGKFTIYDSTANASRLIVDANGNVGIGTTSPSNTLHVVGSLCVKSAAGNCAGSTAGTIYATTTTVASADLAEHMPVTDASLEAGDVVVAEAAATAEGMAFSKSKRPRQENASGVVSTSPGVVLGSDTASSRPIALAGRVPVNVTTEGGAIAVGDFLVPSSTPGKAMRASGPTDAGIIGIALSAYDGSPVSAKDWNDGIAHEVGHQVMMLVQLGAGSQAAVAHLKARADKADAESAQIKAEAAQIKAEAAQIKAEAAQIKAAMCARFGDLDLCR